MGLLDGIKSRAAEINKTPARPRPGNGTPVQSGAPSAVNWDIPETPGPLSVQRASGPLFGVAAAAVAVTPAPFVGGRPLKRRRQSETDLWTPRKQKKHVDYAEKVAEEYSLDSEQTAELIQVAEAPSFYDGFILFAAQMKRQDIDRTVWMGEMWLQSDDFKSHIQDALSGYLLDGNVSAYKGGLTDRFVRHVRTKPSGYCVPKHVWGFLANHKFRSHISNVLSGLRSEIKGKLGSKENRKNDIYTLLQSLIGGTNTRTHSKIAITPQMWGRVAWLYYALEEHEKIVKKGKKKDKDFWDDVDAELRDIRYQYSIYDEPVKSQKISVYFNLCLEKHKAEKKPKKGAKPIPDSFPISSWQRQLQAAIEEMNDYDVSETTALIQGTSVGDRPLEDIDADIEAERAERAACRNRAEGEDEGQPEGGIANA
ncbi:hypothetical protein CONPUDRAFT_160130 [Coniophora puteana RWD-64-598 SS2]|uniref:Uncharacterized protein n=1 Tax=Coniophora puteana (strain RWD-64-598) TaxID=741705 RepID=R7SE26_CONPW|nr:uncharacterized protein CONPUDRAFT_160130 [Coniophora puteana RWD-64-598 SS2]EIW74426.1 hypothetical protein CONPUDRAFT_160130 [Coniophora puteana RWD-64-598 SS2]